LNLNGIDFNPTGTVTNQNITANDSTITMASPYNYTNDSFNLYNSVVNVGALTTEPLRLNTLLLSNSTINITSSDVDFVTNTMGRITADSYSATANSVINLNSLNLLNTPNESKSVINIPFADTSIASNVKYHGQTSFETALYRYGIAYNSKDGTMMFIRGGQFNSTTGKYEYSSNPSEAFNPVLMATAASSQVGAVSTMAQTYNYAFQHSENFMALPNLLRTALLNKNRYALSETSTVSDSCADILFTPDSGSAWYKPYVSFESVPLKNGPKVNSTTYGSLAGFDTPIREFKNGWYGTWTGYVGYNGAHQTYGGVNSYQNGGLLGATLTMYKGNLFTATSLNAGASVSETSSKYGTDNSTMLLAGVANRTGYNFEFKQGRYIVQPNLFVSYSFVNTFDYTNAAGVRVTSEPLHSIQVAPGLRLMMNTKNEWHPYIAMNMVWNILDKSKVTADAVRLPDASVKPYFQYGIGVQRHFKENIMAFGQVMMQNGGRNGVSLTAGVRWSIGKEGKPIQKVESNKDIKMSNNNQTSSFVKNNSKVGNVTMKTSGSIDRKVIKSLQSNKTSMTTGKANIKQL
jgi:outer membrane autotransporter protein